VTPEVDAPEGERAIGPVDDAGDVSISSGPLPDRAGEHAFEVEADCPVARVEFAMHVTGWKPSGPVTVRAPNGARAQLGVHVMSSIDFVKTWDWAQLADLHSLRGRSARGTWRLRYRLESVERGGPPGSVPDATLRIWCEPAAEAATTRELRGDVRAEARAPHPGGSVRAMLAVTRDCAIEDLAVDLVAEREFAFGERWRLTAPDGTRHVVASWEPTTGEDLERKTVANVPSVRGLRSAGIWELAAPRALGGLELTRFGMTIRCAE
jgi:hypothetical protein